jgi:hypothetical protein
MANKEAYFRRDWDDGGDFYARGATVLLDEETYDAALAAGVARPGAPFDPGAAGDIAGVTSLQGDDADLSGIRSINGGPFGCAPPCAGRLTLATGVPVQTSDVTAATAVYLTPYAGDGLALYDGSLWSLRRLGGELALPLDADSGHAGYHQADKNFDVFAFDDAGTLRIGTGPAWATDTSRGSGAGTTEITRLDGALVNAVAIDLRYGASSGDVVSAVPIGRALYLGTIRASAGGQCEDSKAKRFAWNMYNRVARPMRVIEATDSWAGPGDAWRQMNNSASNQLAFVLGAAGDLVEAYVNLSGFNSTSTRRAVRAGIGLDATTAFAADCLPQTAQVDPSAQPVSAIYRGYPGAGYHFLAALERGHASDAQTFIGDSGVPLLIQSGIIGTVWG